LTVTTCRCRNRSHFDESIEGANLPDRRLAPSGADVFAPPWAAIGLKPTTLESRGARLGITRKRAN
jgi:hypothetical protein